MDVAWRRRTMQYRSGRGPSAPLPSQIFVPGVLGSYLVRPLYVTLMGGNITGVVNESNPGVADLNGAVAPPVYIASEPIFDGHPAVGFNGAQLLQTANNAFALGNKDTVDAYTVQAHTGTIPTGAPGLFITLDNIGVGYSVYLTHNPTTTMQAATITDPAGNVATAAVALDNVGHLWGATTYNDGTGQSTGAGYFDGVQMVTAAAQDGLLHGCSRAWWGAGGFVSYTTSKASEFVIVGNETAGDGHRLAYQNQRIKIVYPTIGALLP